MKSNIIWIFLGIALVPWGMLTPIAPYNYIGTGVQLLCLLIAVGIIMRERVNDNHK